MDSKSNIVKESLPCNIRSSGTLKVISVIVQHDHRCYLKSDIKRGQTVSKSKVLATAESSVS